ncbi:DUF1349 domain-containing protein [Altericista sp. CCNU0014]|uniref:DUF1349 domain-containing protein n=1 Tax=Altericista sp. CCNU0014 TaxID=3082949 RepID=UPI0038506D54
MQWLNEPPKWSHSGNQIVIKTAPKTDFWHITHYGFIRDSGHFYFDAIATDFTVSVKFRGQYKDLYDQAGLMIRADEKHWIKTGIEYVDGSQHLSAVVTHEYSDWSMTPLVNPPETFQLRVERVGDAIHIASWSEAAGYQLFRMTYLPSLIPLQVGVMCASPEGDGYEVVFEDYCIETSV